MKSTAVSMSTGSICFFSTASRACLCTTTNILSMSRCSIIKGPIGFICDSPYDCRQAQQSAGLAFEGPALSACFFHEADLGERHGAVRRFAHVVDCKAGGGHRRQRLHLDASAVYRLRRGPDVYARSGMVGLEVDFHG